MAQDPMAHAAMPGTVNPQDYFLTLGPYGALVWGAYILGKGVNLTINVKLADDDRKLVERGVEALEKKP
jgi:heme exporter protein D